MSVKKKKKKKGGGGGGVPVNWLRLSKIAVKRTFSFNCRWCNHKVWDDFQLCRKTKTTVITLANHKVQRYFSEPYNL